MKEETRSNVVSMSTAFTTVAVGCLALSCSLLLLDLRVVQKAQAINLRCDAVRQLALASKYEAQAAIVELGKIAKDL